MVGIAKFDLWITRCDLDAASTNNCKPPTIVETSHLQVDPSPKERVPAQPPRQEVEGQYEGCKEDEHE